MKKIHVAKTTLPPKIIEAFEHFYDGMEGISASQAERRLRDVMVEFWKTDSALRDNSSELMEDLYFIFMLLDACADFPIEADSAPRRETNGRKFSLQKLRKKG